MSTNHTRGQKGIAQAALVAATTGLSVLALTSGVLAAPPSAHAYPTVPLAPACQDWKLNSNTLSLGLSNGHRVELPWNGMFAGPGEARLYNAGSADEIGYGNVSSGGISHGHLDFTIFWFSPIENKDANHFVGDVDKMGSASGYTTNTKGARADWNANEHFECATPAPADAPAPQAPPPRPVGKAKTATVVGEDVNVYNAKNEPDGAGTVVGILRVGQQVTLLDSCKPQAWCQVAGPAVPSGQGWVWGHLQLP
jgi:hypothetical protein